MCHRDEYIITLAIEMAIQPEFVAGHKISATRGSLDRQRLGRLGLHPKLYRSFVILEDFLQPLGLIAATGGNAVITEGVPAREIVDFQRSVCLAVQLMQDRSGLAHEAMMLAFASRFWVGC